MQFSDITPSLAQAIHMKKLEQENKLDTDKLEEIMSQEKPNQVHQWCQIIFCRSSRFFVHCFQFHFICEDRQREKNAASKDYSR